MNTIRILGRDYAIDMVSPTRFTQMELGMCDNKNQIIHLATDQTPIEAADTLLHEVIHAIDFLVGLDLSEHQVRHLAATLLGVLQDNPEIAEWLIADKTQERIDNEQPKSIRKRTRKPARGSRKSAA